MIIGEIQRFIRDDGTIKVSRTMKELGNKIRVMKEELTKELNRSPTIQEVADELGITPEEVVKRKKRSKILTRFMKQSMKMAENRLHYSIKLRMTIKNGSINYR